MKASKFSDAQKAFIIRQGDQATKGPLNDPSRLPPTLAGHRRAHRSGVPARLASDPSVRLSSAPGSTI